MTEKLHRAVAVDRQADVIDHLAEVHLHGEKFLRIPAQFPDRLFRERPESDRAEQSHREPLLPQPGDDFPADPGGDPVSDQDQGGVGGPE